MIIKILWKLIVDKKKEYLDSQLNTFQQNTVNNEQQLKHLQKSARKQISLEGKATATSIVTNLAKQKVMSLSKEIIPAMVKQS